MHPPVLRATTGYTSEIKFLVDAAIGQRIADWARQHLPPDPHGNGPHRDEYRVTSLYFDTDAHDVFFRRGSYGRSKYRIRRYHHEPVVFLERKLRTGSRLAKRRTSIDLTTLPLLASNGHAADVATWFRRRVQLRRLRPVCQVSYLRIARGDDTPAGPARLTLDRALVAGATDVLTFEERATTPVLGDCMILELKYRGVAPAVFRQLVETFALQPRRASKYRSAASMLGLVASVDEGEAPHTVHA